MLVEGTKLKEISAKDSDGNTHHFSDYLGKKIVLFFYPEDDSPGCTIEACNYRDAYASFKNSNVILLGISPDSQESHQKFIKKYQLPYPLLLDEAHEIADYFGAWGTKNLYGHIKIGIIRSTFIIDENGYIEKVFKRASAKSNTEAVYVYLKG